MMKGEKMKFLEKLGKVMMNNIAYTVVLIVALVCFLYFSSGDLIAGLFTVVSALVMYICGAALYHEYKKMPAGKTVASKSGKKTSKRK